jgi:replicative DNA helicase
MADEFPPPSDDDAPRFAARAPVVDLDTRRKRARQELPHNLTCEMAILGGILIQQDLLRDPRIDLETDSFYDPRHKAVWSAMVNLDAEREPIDLATVETELERAGKLDMVGGIAFLAQLALHVPTPDNVVYYAKIVRDKHAARQVMLKAAEIVDRIGRGTIEHPEAVAQLVALQGVTDRAAGGPEPGTWPHAIATALADVRALTGAAEVVDATPAPLFTLDAVDLLSREFPETQWLVTGLATRGGLVVIGGEPKTAKTWLGTEIAIAVATGTPVCGEFYATAGTVAYFYAEDLDRQVRNRTRALLAGADRRLAAGRFIPQPRGKFLDVTRDEDLALIVASCRRLGAIDLLVLDPLRDISSAAEDKSDEMGPVMRRLRLLGEILRCTVAVVHHAAKASIDTAKRRPGQRLRGSGAIHGSTDSGIYLSDLESDDPHVFKNTIDSEIKGARSAGGFTVTLTVEDDEQGEAVKATWAVDRDEVAAKRAAARSRRSEGDIQDEIVRVVRSNAEGFASKNAIAAVVGGKKATVMKLIGDMIGAQLALQGGRIVAADRAGSGAP